MRELTQEELQLVVGGTLPSYADKPAIQQAYNFITENYYQYGVGVVGMESASDLRELLRKIIERIFPPTEHEDRQQMIDHCQSQGKTAVFISGGGGVAVSINPVGKSVKLESSNGQSTQYCQ